MQRLISSGNFAKTTYAYYDTGQLYTTTDPCGNTNCTDVAGTNHTTTYSYGDNFAAGTGTPPGQTNAYLTSVALPNTGVAHTRSFTWGYSDGQLRSATDENGQTANYQYNDPLARLTQISNPDGGGSTYTYTDTAPNPTVASSTLMGQDLSNTPLTHTSVMDGMGHPIQSQLTSDPQGTDYTATSYDGFGRPYHVYNPTRCNPPTSNCGESTWGYTTNTYDALGRPISVLEQDGSSVSTVYSGNCTTVTDEAGKARKTCVDGLGRLTQVFEDPAVANFLTLYNYDALGNLLCVWQRGSDTTAVPAFTFNPSTNTSNCLSAVPAVWRARSFSYDSLSRLISATNPESGTISYVYDADGNVSTKTAPSPNSASNGSTVTTHYSYDALNRLTGKSYVDSYASNPPTASVMYIYDGLGTKCPAPLSMAPYGWGGPQNQHGVGRRTGLCDGSGMKSYGYDTMGRQTQENDVFLNVVAPYSANVGTFNGVVNLSTDSSWVYYLNGDLGNFFYPHPNSVPGYEFYTSENAARNVIQAGDRTYYARINGTFAPNGALLTANVGYWGADSVSNTYNSRLQPLLVSASKYQGSPFLSLTYNFNAGGGDNGNVIAITNNLDGNRTQNFTYDTLNRIRTAYTTGPNWGETFDKDPWGNLKKISGYTGKTLTETLNVTPNTKNQLVGFAYDPAGNMINDGLHSYVYDAENRLVQVDGATSYVYDGDGKRVAKCTSAAVPGTCATNATGRFYFYSVDGAVMAESDLGGNWTASYGVVRGQRTFRVDLPGQTVHYYFQDHLGSTSSITDSTGALISQSDFFPYGGEIPVIGGDPNNRYKFTGKERDSESNLDYFGARHYTSEMGRFMSADPSRLSVFFANPQTWNRYSYVYNNPLGLTDDNGKWPTDIHNQIIDKAFPNLTAAQRQILKNISARQDSILMGGQANSGAYQHAMRGPHQTVEQAEHQFNDFVSGSEASAQTAEWTFVLNDPDSKYGLSLGDEALAEFAEALHAIVDSTSPAHEGFQVWDWRNPSLVITHMNAEKTINPQQMQNAITGARNAFNSTFGMFGFTIAPPPPEPKPHVTHKICYTEDKGKKVCQ